MMSELNLQVSFEATVYVVRRHVVIEHKLVLFSHNLTQNRGEHCTTNQQCKALSHLLTFSR